MYTGHTSTRDTYTAVLASLYAEAFDQHATRMPSLPGMYMHTLTCCCLLCGLTTGS